MGWQRPCSLLNGKQLFWRTLLWETAALTDFIQTAALTDFIQLVITKSLLSLASLWTMLMYLRVLQLVTTKSFPVSSIYPDRDPKTGTLTKSSFVGSRFCSKRSKGISRHPFNLASFHFGFRDSPLSPRHINALSVHLLGRPVMVVCAVTMALWIHNSGAS